MKTAWVNGYTHGWQTCRECHQGGSDVTRESLWHLRANPGYWGASSPEILVLGFSKGANQIDAAERGEFDGVAFARMRGRLRAVLATLGLASKDMDIDAAMRAEGDLFGFASLIRCGMSLEQGGSLVTSGTVMPKALRSPWARAVMDRCIRQHLFDLPASVRTVVLLGSADAYIEGVKALMDTVFSDYREINDVAFHAAGRPWIFAAHPSPGNGHFASWLNEPNAGPQGRKRALAVAALCAEPTRHLAEGHLTMSTVIRPDTATAVVSPPKKPRKSADLPSDEVLAKNFHLIDATGSILIPIRMKNRDTGIVAFRLHRRGAGGNTKENGMREMHDEREAYCLVESGSWGIRTVCKRTGKKGIRYLGVNVREVKWSAQPA